MNNRNNKNGNGNGVINGDGEVVLVPMYDTYYIANYGIYIRALGKKAYLLMKKGDYGKKKN